MIAAVITLPAALRKGPDARRKGAAGLLFAAIIRHDLRSLAFNMFACGIAATVATFQFAVFTSFLAAGAAAPRMLAPAAWISDRGVACFDFPTLISQEYAGPLLSELPGARFTRVLIGFTGWLSPDGSRGNVAVIGTDDSGLAPRHFRADASDLARLQLTPGRSEASIGGISVQLAGTTGQLATFLGAPYVVVPFDLARMALGAPRDSVSFLAVRFDGSVPADLAERLKRIEARFPEISARTGTDFEASSSRYWQNKTGAGAAILLAAVLAAMLMLILLINGVGRFVQRRQGDLVSMIGHGARPADIHLLLTAIAGFVTLSSLAQAFVLVPVADALSSHWLPWVHFKPVDLVFAVVMALACLAASAWSATRDIKGIPADAIFRS